MDRIPVHRTCKIQGAQRMIFMKKQRFSSHPWATVKRQEPMGTARAQPCIQTALVLFYYII